MFLAAITFPQVSLDHHPNKAQVLAKREENCGALVLQVIYNNNPIHEQVSEKQEKNLVPEKKAVR